MLETALTLLYLTAVVKTKEEGVYFKVRENHFLLDENTVCGNQKVDSLLSCSQICGRRNDCKYANFKKDQGICSISDRESPGKVVQRQGYFYLKKVGQLSVIFDSCNSQFLVEEINLDEAKKYLHLVERALETADYLSYRRIKLDELSVQNGQRHFFTLGNLRSNDADGNKKVIKIIGLMSKTTTLQVHHTFMYISFSFLHD